MVRCFGCQVIEGYGMTETSCAISTMDDGDTLSGHVGSPSPACGKLFDWLHGLKINLPKWSWNTWSHHLGYGFDAFWESEDNCVKELRRVQYLF